MTVTTPDLAAAADAIDLADRVVGKAVRHLASLEGGADAHQVLAYDLAHAAAGVATAKSLLDYGNKGDVEAKITCAYAADMIHDVSTKILGREDDWGVERGALDNAHAFMTLFRDPAFLASLAQQPGPFHLSDDMEMVSDTFDSFAQNVIAPHAEHVHRTNADVPEEIVSGMAELGAFGLSVPSEYGGFGEGGDFKVQLPFIVVNTSNSAVIKCEMDAKRTGVKFDFSLPFEINDDNEILKRMQL